MSIELKSETNLVDSNDACFAWLQEKAQEKVDQLYKEKNYDDKTLLKKVRKSLKNDVRACSELCWSRFAFPSEPNTPLRNNYNNEKGKSLVQLKDLKDETEDGLVLTLSENEKSHNKDSMKGGSWETEPSRFVFRDALLKSKSLSYSEENIQDSLQTERPLYGGYFSFNSPLQDHFRFLVFPQKDHSLLQGEAGGVLPEDHLKRRLSITPQPVSHYWRGTVRHQIDKSNPPDDTVPSNQDRYSWWNSWGINVFGAFKQPFKDYNVLETEVSVRQTRDERQFSQERNKVQKCTLVSDGVRLKGQRSGNPRYADSIGIHSTVVQASSKSPALETTRIGTIEWRNHYQSTKQTAKIPSWWAKITSVDPSEAVKYSVSWSGGPGVEYCSEDAKVSVFGALESLARVELPLPKNLSLLLHHQASVVSPFQWIRTEPNSEAAKESAATESRLGPHRYFWATQGPRWDPNLLRGFSNDFSSLHHAKKWYSILSLEVGKNQNHSKNKSDSPSEETTKDGGIKGFVNLCFADTFKQYPRASVGFSMVSATPKTTIDAFNKILPSRFECSFSWFVSFDKKTLETGMQPGVQQEGQFLRISPVETFRHMKCGLTWKFE